MRSHLLVDLEEGLLLARDHEFPLAKGSGSRSEIAKKPRFIQTSVTQDPSGAGVHGTATSSRGGGHARLP
jgi:hypothetical protein